MWIQNGIPPSVWDKCGPLKLYLYSKRRWGASSDAGAAAEISATLQCDINAVRKVNINRRALAAGRCAMDTAMFRYHCWRSAQSTRMTDACRANRAFSHWTNFWSRFCLFCFFSYLSAEVDKRSCLSVCLHMSHVVKYLSKTNTPCILTYITVCGVSLYCLFWHIWIVILSSVNIFGPQQLWNTFNLTFTAFTCKYISQYPFIYNCRPLFIHIQMLTYGLIMHLC